MIDVNVNLRRQKQPAHELLNTEEGIKHRKKKLYHFINDTASFLFINSTGSINKLMGISLHYGHASFDKLIR